MEELTQLRKLALDEARKRLVALARARGPAALDVLRATLADPALAEAALEALAEVPAQEAWDLLEQAAQSETAGRRKAARRGQHRLRSRGFRPAPPTTTRQEAAPVVEQVRATSFDVPGNQFLRLVRPAALGMAHYADFIVGPEGLIECDYLLRNRSDLDEILREQAEKFGPDLIEVGLPYVARRARAAATHSRAAGKTLPRDWTEAARLLEGASEDPLPDELADVSSEEVLTAQAAALLFRHRSMARWLLDPDRLKPYAQEWLRLLQYQPIRIQEGVFNLGAIQSRGQLTARIIADLCDPATTRRFVGQLDEQARLFFALGALDLARLARRCSASLEQRPDLDNPFLRALVEESMELAVQLLQEEEEEEEESRSPWVSAEAAAGPLWLPRPAASEEDEEEKAPRLWLPGQP